VGTNHRTTVTPSLLFTLFVRIPSRAEIPSTQLRFFSAKLAMHQQPMSMTSMTMQQETLERAEQAEDGERKIPAPSVTTVYAHLQPQLDGRALQSHAQHTPPDTPTHTWGGGGGSLPMAPPLRPLSFDKRAAAAGRVGERDPTICHVRRGWIASPRLPLLQLQLQHTPQPPIHHPLPRPPSCSCLID
jgi:hypothetical protein